MLTVLFGTLARLADPLENRAAVALQLCLGIVPGRKLGAGILEPLPRLVHRLGEGMMLVLERDNVGLEPSQPLPELIAPRPARLELRPRLDMCALQLLGRGLVVDALRFERLQSRANPRQLLCRRLRLIRQPANRGLQTLDFLAAGDDAHLWIVARGRAQRVCRNLDAFRRHDGLAGAELTALRERSFDRGRRIHAAEQRTRGRWLAHLAGEQLQTGKRSVCRRRRLTRLQDGEPAVAQHFEIGRDRLEPVGLDGIEVAAEDGLHRPLPAGLDLQPGGKAGRLVAVVPGQPARCRLGDPPERRFLQCFERAEAPLVAL